MGDPTGQYPYEESRWCDDGGKDLDNGKMLQSHDYLFRDDKKTLDDNQAYKDEHYLFGDEDMLKLTSAEQIQICRAMRRAKLHIEQIALREKNNRMTPKERAGQFATSLKREMSSLGFAGHIIGEFCNPEVWADAGVLVNNNNMPWRTIKFMDNNHLTFADPLVDYAKSLPTDQNEELGRISMGLDALRRDMSTFSFHIKNAVAINEESDKVVQNLTTILAENS